MRIAFIGTGVMGAPMARHLADAGHDVTVFNRTFEKAKALEPQLKAVSTVAEAVKDAEVVMSIVGYPNDVRDVYDQVFKYARPKTVLIDMTTSSPRLAVMLAKMAENHDMVMLDAPVTGGDTGARNGTLSIMVGGDKETYLRMRPLFDVLGKTVTYMGGPGNGQHMKLANQIVIAGNIAGIAEALVYAKVKHLDPEEMLKVITGGSASSWQASNNGPKMVAGDMEPGFFVKHYLKDLKLANFEKRNLDLPVLEVVSQIFDDLEREGKGDLGTQAIIRWYMDKMA
jgi:3-hydroxyisobutyrate dehydrogenase